MADTQRTEELLKRVLNDPTSIAFAQLAEEYRRDGRYQDAIEACRAGLAHHPLYLSARVTLGRALMELEQFDEAQRELDVVLDHAPDNLAAIRTLGEIHRRRADSGPRASERPEVPAAPVAFPPIADEAATQALPDAPDFSLVQRDSLDPSPIDPALTALEKWLGAIVDDRSSRG